MDEDNNIYFQLGMTIQSEEELETKQEEARKETAKLTGSYVEVSNGVKVPPEQAEAELIPSGNQKITPAVAPTDEQQPKKFVAMLNGVATNQLAMISSRSAKIEKDKVYGYDIIKSGKLKVVIGGEEFDGIATNGLRISTHKLLNVCTIALTQQNNYRGRTDRIKPQVEIPLESFMEMCGIPLTKPSKDKTRRRVAEDLETLFQIRLSWKEPRKKQTKDYDEIRLCQRKGIKNGIIFFKFSDDMAEYLTNAYIMQYPLELLKVDERNPSAYNIGLKLALQSFNTNNIRQGTADIISVKSLLAVCPEIPSYETVKEKGRQVDQRIIAPLVKALDSLPIWWEYSNSKKEKLTKEQTDSASYSSFSDLFIHFGFGDPPDQTDRLEGKNKTQETNETENTPEE